MNHEREVVRARVQLTATSPFWGALSAALKVRIIPGIKTARTDGTHLDFDPAYLESKPFSEIKTTVAHEVCHVFLKHTFRIKGRNKKLANIAADHVVNLLLKRAGFHIPEGWLCDERFEDMYFEQVYAIIKKEHDDEQERKRQEQEALKQQAEEEEQQAGQGDSDEDSDDEDENEDEDDQEESEEGDESDDDGESKEDEEEEGDETITEGWTKPSDSDEDSDSDSEQDDEDDDEDTDDDSSGQDSDDDSESDSDDMSEEAGGGTQGSGEEEDWVDELPSYFTEPESSEEEGDDPEERQLNEEDWNILVEQALSVARRAGDVPAGIDRAIEAARALNTDWRTVLRQFIQNICKLSYTWSSPAKRYLAAGIYLPSFKNDGLPALGLGNDTSGSVRNEYQAVVGGELTSIMYELKPERIDVFHCDEMVHAIEEFTPDGSEIKLNALGGGGTKFQPVFDAMNERSLTQGINYKGCIFFSEDLDHFDQLTEPDFPVLWIVPQYCRKNSMKFGEVVRIDLYE